MKVLVADKDRDYANRLAMLLAEIKNDFEIYTVFTIDDIYESDKKKPVDILLIDSELYLELSQDPGRMIIILMFSDLLSSSVITLPYVYKYQNSHAIAKRILEVFLEERPESQVLANNSKARIIVVYSPLGGSGKTVISRALVQNLQHAGFRCLYWNLEVFSSQMLQNMHRGDMSQLLKAAHLRESLPLLANSLLKKNEHPEYSFFNSIDSVYDLVEAKNDDVEYLAEQLREAKLAEYIIIDCDSGYYTWHEKLFDLAEVIFLINLENRLAYNKFQSFKSLTSYYMKYIGKTKFIMNRVNQIDERSEYIQIAKYNLDDDNQVIDSIAYDVDFRLRQR